MSKLIKECGRYTTIPENITRDKELDLKSRGMLLTLLSLPDNWVFSEMGLVALLPTEGRDSVRNTLKKLEKLGYLKRERARGTDGLLGGINYIISDTRQKNFDVITLNPPMSGFPTQVKPTQVEPWQEKPMQVNPTEYRKGKYYEFRIHKEKQ